jgi:hypothetical protein
MIDDEHRMNSRVDRSRAALARDAAISRIGRTRRWVIAGTAALTAGFAALVSAVAPGRSLASKSPSAAKTTTDARPSSSTTAIPQFPPAANPSSLGLQAPNQPPQSVPSSPSTTPPQSSPAPTTPSAPAPQPAAPQPAPQSSGGGGVVSGGS